jgi:enoyl-CoA hydratase
MKLEHFRIEIVDYVATVTFDRPPVNAINRQSREEMIQVFDTLSDHNDVRAVILTATGNYFSAGADIKERSSLAQDAGDIARHNRLTREFFYAVTDCTKPVIAAVNGPAMGAGVGIMLACDIMLAADNAWFSMPELDIGMAGGGRFLTQHFTRSQARYMYFTARRIPAAEYYRLGVIQECLALDELMPAAAKLAREIAAKSPVAMRWVKRAFNTVEEMPTREGYRFEQSVTADLSKTDDAKEAQRAFAERRKPEFKDG